MLRVIEKPIKNKEEKRIAKQFKWVKQYKEFLKELDSINGKINAIQKRIKTKGLTEKTSKKCMKLISELKNSHKTKIIKNELQKYFNETSMLLPDQKKILATSDIIESSFGKYKNFLSNNYMAGITDLALCIAAFTSELSDNDIKEALENTTMEDLKKWKKENIGITLLQKRRIVLSSN